MATYGRSFTLSSPDHNGFNAATSGGGKAGEFTREAGFLAFYEICQLLKDGEASYVWDEEQKVPYAVSGDLWVGFDDERSLKEKIKWLLNNGYAGAMVWTVDMDDFTGHCSGTRNPLIGTLKEYLMAGPRVVSNMASIIKKAELVPLKKPTTPNPETNTINRKPEVTEAPKVSDSSPPMTNARIVCYLTNWSQKRPGAGKFDPEFIDPFLCTHIIYAFAGLKDNKLVPTEDTDTGGMYQKTVALKEKNPNLKVLLAVGGWMVGPNPFKELTENVYRQTLFTFSAVEFLRTHKFDGLDLCWEFPRGSEDKERYTKLVKVSYITISVSYTTSSFVPSLLPLII